MKKYIKWKFKPFAHYYLRNENYTVLQRTQLFPHSNEIGDIVQFNYMLQYNNALKLNFSGKNSVYVGVGVGFCFCFCFVFFYIEINTVLKNDRAKQFVLILRK